MMDSIDVMHKESDSASLPAMMRYEHGQVVPHRARSSAWREATRPGTAERPYGRRHPPASAFAVVWLGGPDSVV